MNQALNALNIARPVHPAATAGATASGSSETQPARGFDSALDAARAAQSSHGAAPHDASTVARSGTRASARTGASADTRNDAHATNEGADDAQDKAPATGTADHAQAATPGTDKDGKADAGDDGSKKDDASVKDTSLATTMLALIGVPPTVTELAGKAMATLKAATGKDVAALGGAPGPGLPVAGTAVVADGAVQGAKDGLLAGHGVDAAPVPVASPVATASPFAALLAANGASPSGAKDDASPADPTTSPMPLVHAPAMAAVAAPALQVQATQAATSPAFAQELGEQISWMGSGQIKEARIKLHPEELGSMDVRVTMDGGKVNVAIMAQHPAAVHAVQQTLSQLDTLLAHHGLSLGQADVGQRDTGQGTHGGAQAGQDGPGRDDAGATTATLATSRVSRSLVDEVA